jgi:hypothetical protein
LRLFGVCNQRLSFDQSASLLAVIISAQPYSDELGIGNLVINELTACDLGNVERDLCLRTYVGGKDHCQHQDSKSVPFHGYFSSAQFSRLTLTQVNALEPTQLARSGLYELPIRRDHQ